MKVTLLVQGTQATEVNGVRELLQKNGHDVRLRSSEEMQLLEQRANRAEGKSEDFGKFTSESPAMKRVHEQLSTLRKDSMKGDMPEAHVVLTGEIGAGHESIARVIHQGSRRARGPWVTVNCFEVFASHFDREFLGTGDHFGVLELAQAGTLYLNHIDRLDQICQARLLEVLKSGKFKREGAHQESSVEVRIIASADPDFHAQVREGKFNKDLAQTLTQMSISLPPLRERSEDILPLAKHLAVQCFRKQGKNFEGFSQDAESALRSHRWPGNLNELHSMIEHASTVSGSRGTIGKGDLLMPVMGPISTGVPLQVVTTTDGVEQMNFTDLKKKWCDSFEREYLTSVLGRHAGNVSSAARESKLDRSNFLRLLRRHGIKSKEYRKAA